jgi:hypothetical protein
MSIFTEKGTGHGGRKGGFRSFAKSFGTSFIGALPDSPLLQQKKRGGKGYPDQSNPATRAESSNPGKPLI